MDLSISRRRKQLNPLTRDNKRLLPNRVRVPSVLRAPRSCACRDCDARQRRSARPGCRGELDRESLSLARGFASGAVGDSCWRRHFAGTLPQTSRRGEGEKQRQKQNIQGWVVFNQSKPLPVHSQEHAGNREPTLLRALSQELPAQFLQFLGCVCRLIWPEDLLTALANGLNSLPCASCPLTSDWETMLSCPQLLGQKCGAESIGRTY